MKVPEIVYKRAVQLLQDADEITVSAILRQERANTGSIVSFSLDSNRYVLLFYTVDATNYRAHIGPRALSESTDLKNKKYTHYIWQAGTAWENQSILVARQKKKKKKCWKKTPHKTIFRTKYWEFRKTKYGRAGNSNLLTYDVDNSILSTVPVVMTPADE